MFWVITGVAVWLCPFWLIPTPVVLPLLWGGFILGAWLCVDAYSSRRFMRLQNAVTLPLAFWGLLVSLTLMIAWRSNNLQNTLAAALCLGGIGLAAHLSARWALSTQSQKWASWLAWGWLLAGLCNAAFGLLQYFGWTLEPKGLAFGWLRQRNHLATLCNMALLSLLYLGYVGRGAWNKTHLDFRRKTHQTTIIQAGIWLLACCLLTAALAATCSRAGFLELVLLQIPLLGWALLQRQTALARAVFCALASYTLWIYALPWLSGASETIIDRILNMQGNPNEPWAASDSRSILWRNVGVVIQAQPILGVGWRELALALKTVDLGAVPRFGEQADHTHNLLLQFAAELGLPFTALWCALLGFLLVRSQFWHQITPVKSLAWGVLAVIAIHSLVEYPLWYAPFQLALGLAAGLALAQPSPKPAERAFSSHTQRPSWLARQNWQGAVGMILMIFCLYAAFEYRRVQQVFATAQLPARPIWLFANQVRFAQLLVTPITPANAVQMEVLAQKVLHFSPEPLVFERLKEAQKIKAQTLPERF